VRGRSGNWPSYRDGGHWTFDGLTIAGTRVFDASGSGNYGTMTNGPTLVNGKLGQGLSFDGSDD
jgi:hypothetical protein